MKQTTHNTNYIYYWLDILHMKLGQSALAAADYFIVKSEGNLSPLQIIKLVYISHGWLLVIHNEPLIQDRIEAWKRGPVIPTIYHALKKHKWNPVRNLYYCNTKIDSSDIVDRKKFLNTLFTENSKTIMDRVWELYGTMSADELSNMTHKKDTPWDTCYVKNQLYTQIPNDIIQNHYSEIGHARSK